MTPEPTPTTPDILLFDVMSTLVYDPYAVELPALFNMDLAELMARKHPDAWVRFEHGELDEDAFYTIFLPDGPAIDAEALRQTLFDAYAYLPGIEPLLEALRAQGVAMHTLSNYPTWYHIIEQKLAISRYMPWTFVSCNTGLRKPDLAVYEHAARTLGVAPQRCLFIDDRRSNCRAAIEAGMHAITFTDADTLRHDLITRGILNQKR